MIRLTMYKLVNGDNFLVVGEHHHMKHIRGYRLHGIHVATSEKDIVIKWGIDNFNVNQDGFAPKFYRDILEYPFMGRWETIVISQGDGRWY
jgi:hypothetical protein